MHLPVLDQGIVIVADVADAVALQLPAAVLPLAFLDVVLGPGEGRNDLFPVADCIPPAMIEVQVRVDDNIDVLGSNSCRAQGIRSEERRVGKEWIYRSRT